jgi:hypothetical protein
MRSEHGLLMHFILETPNMVRVACNPMHASDFVKSLVRNQTARVISTTFAD